jgi:uncharacterized phiE125 gp8 family phage protein
MYSTYLQLITPHIDLPITLDGARMQLDELGTDKDPLINTLIASAARYVEDHCRISLMPQLFEERMDAWPKDNKWEVRKYPFISISSIKYIDLDGDEQTLDPAGYGYSMQWDIPYIYLLDGISITAKTQIDAIKLQYYAGYEVPGTIPDTIIDAMMLIVRERYDHPQGTNVDIPTAALNLLKYHIRHEQ